MTLFGQSEAALSAAGGLHTAREIAHQPQTLAAIHALLVAERTGIEAFLTPLITRPDLRVILTGAGTSAFIGTCLVPALAGQLACRVAAMATTDIVAGPDSCFEPDTPTLLISFGRSGNSPESVAAIDLADRLIHDCSHLAITCNSDGALAKRLKSSPRSHVITLPDETHDRGFAMTSSFTGMMLAALICLTGNRQFGNRIGPIVEAVTNLTQRTAGMMQSLAQTGFDRVVYLGSNGFKGLAQEAALKLLELSDGATIATFDTPLGFRHGPKTIVTDNTLIILFVSNNPYTRRYDLDLLDELRSDGKARRIIALSALPLDGPDVFLIPELAGAIDCDLLFPMIVPAQMFAFNQSLALGKTPDNPNAAGLVNRVVQGVAIHAMGPA
jgi:tagatose-6-phosphate ketose/aldose isomerase